MKENMINKDASGATLEDICVKPNEVYPKDIEHLDDTLKALEEEAIDER